eukprot:scaffold655_cov379-Prasinococcus_capsulatus_cf.AAC.26
MRVCRRRLVKKHTLAGPPRPPQAWLSQSTYRIPKAREEAHLDRCRPRRTSTLALQQVVPGAPASGDAYTTLLFRGSSARSHHLATTPLWSSAAGAAVADIRTWRCSAW